MRSILLLLFYCTSVGILAAQSSSEVSRVQLDALAWSESNRVLEHIADPDYPPFEFKDQLGITEGMGTDFLYAVCRKLGIEVKTTSAATWSEALEGLRSNKYHIATVAAKTPDRESYLSFTKPWISVPDVFMVREGGSVGSVFDLEQKTVGIIKDWAANPWLKAKYSAVHFVEIDSITDGLTRVALGRLDGVVLNLASVSYELDRLKIPGLKVLAETGYVYELRFAIPKAQVDLQSIMDRGLDLLSKAERDQIINRWITIHVEPNSLVGEILAIAGVTLVVVTLGFLYLYIRSLRKISKLSTERYVSAKDLNAQYAQYTKKAFMARDKFLSIISHELRTPLTNISGINSLLMQNTSDEAVLSQLKLVETSVKSITSTLEDLLHYSNIESGITSLEYSNFTIERLTESLKQALAPESKGSKKNIAFKVQSDLSGEFFLDFEMLHKMIFDLIDLSMSRAHGDGVQLCIFTHTHSGTDFLRFEVIFSGSPFSQSEYESLFAPFGPSSEAGGDESRTQIKLALCRNMAMGMGGWVDIESRGKTNCMWAEVAYSTKKPSDFTETQKLVGDLYAQLNARQLKILVADDNRTNLMVFSALCKQLGIESVDAVSDGTEAVLTFDEKGADYYACVFLDIEMTIMGGYETAATLRSHGYKGPIIAFTAHSFRNHETQALAAGMNALLLKPIYLDSLTECLKQWVS